MSSAPVLLILGGGSNVGSHVARAFAERGYKVASTSRTPREQGKDGIDLHIQGDLSDPGSVTHVFQKVAQALGPPSVVVYNGRLWMRFSLKTPSLLLTSCQKKAAAATFNAAEDPLSLSIQDLNRDFQINTASVLAAAHEAKAAFDELPSTASRTFIYTGNALNKFPIAPLLSLGVGKSATAHLIASASAAYEKKGYRSAKHIPCALASGPWLQCVLTSIGSTMRTNARQMDRRPFKRLVERCMESSIPNLLKGRARRRSPG